MGIDLSMREELATHDDAVAVACMDTSSGLLLGIQTRGDVERDVVEMAACSAAELCSAPHVSPSRPDEDEECDESFVISSHWVHAYARVPTRRELIVVGLAPGNANVALLRAWIRKVAARVGPTA